MVGAIASTELWRPPTAILNVFADGHGSLLLSCSSLDPIIMIHFSLLLPPIPF